MADGTLTSQTIAATYKSLLKVGEAANGTLTSTPKQIEDGNGNNSALWLATTSVLIGGSGTRLDFNTTNSGEYISGDGTDLTIVSGAEINLNCTTVDINANADISGNLTVGGDIIQGDADWIGIGASAERLEWYTAGDAAFMGCNVGIGTASPLSILEVHSATGTDIRLVRSDASTAAGETLGRILFSSTDGGVDTIDASGVIEVFAAEEYGTGNKGADMSFSLKALGADFNHTAKEYMRITSTGDVGIGTDLPGALLHLEASASALDAFICVESNGANDKSGIQLRQLGTPTFTAGCATGVDLVYDGAIDFLVFRGYTNASGYIGDAFKMKPETVTDTLVLTATGVGIGRTPSYPLDVQGIARFNSPVIRASGVYTIDSGGAIDITSGGFITVNGGNLDFITVNGGTPTFGTEIFITRSSGDLYIRSGTNALVDGDNVSSIRIYTNAGSGGTSILTYSRGLINSSHYVIHLIYSGKWIVLNPANMNLYTTDS